MKNQSNNPLLVGYGDLYARSGRGPRALPLANAFKNIRFLALTSSWKINIAHPKRQRKKP